MYTVTNSIRDYLHYRYSYVYIILERGSVSLISTGQFNAQNISDREASGDGQEISIAVSAQHYSESARVLKRSG